MSESKSLLGNLNRRSFFKTAGIAAGAIALTGTATSLASGDGLDAASVTEEIKFSNCRCACEGGCSHQYTVRNGVVVNARPAECPDPDYTGMCLRGLNNIARTYCKERVKYPMRRVEGTERGAGQWERITWDEAIAEIAEKFCYYRDTFGGQSIMKDGQAGNVSALNGPNQSNAKLASCVGMSTIGDMYDRASCEGTYRVMGVDPYCFSNEPADLQDADMILIWGTNPVYAAPHLWRFCRIAQDKGAKIIVFDPNKSATAHKADQYIPVRAGSDLYLVLGIINHLLTNKLYDEEFVRAHTNAPFLVNRSTGEMWVDSSRSTVASEGAVQYDIGGNVVEAKETVEEGDYYVILNGEATKYADANSVDCELEGSVEVDGVWYDTVFTLLKQAMKEYTLDDASNICNIDRATIDQFIEEYLAADAVTINCAYSMGQYQNGVLWFQAACIMQALTGNYMRHGTGMSGMCSPGPVIDNTVISAAKNPQETCEIPSLVSLDVWRDQKYKGKDHPLKAMITAASNPMSNYCEQNRWFTDVFPNLEFWVVVDNSWSDSACHADIVLPASFWLEVPDFWGGQNTAYGKYAERVIEPLYESLPDAEIFARIGYAMGYTEDFDPSLKAADYIKMALDNDTSREAGWTLDELNKNHTKRTIGSEDDHYVIGSHWSPFPTAHGRLELYWEHPHPRVDYGQEIPEEEYRRERFPYWRAPREAWSENALYEKYPCVLLNVHEKFRTHTQFFNSPFLTEIEGEPFAYVNAEDCEKRGVKNGQHIELFNDRGHCVVKARISADVTPGVIRIPKGWQRSQFIAGGYSELNESYVDPWGVFQAFFDQLVDFRLWNE